MNKAVFIFSLFFLFSCSEDAFIKEELPSDDIHLVVPDGWPYPQNDFSDDPLTKEKFILGRKLFYETKLSSNNKISCGSCHQHSAAFSDEGDAFSPGVNAVLGVRNSPALFNLNWHNEFMWDGRFAQLHDQPLSPITDEREMNEIIERALLKLGTDPEYRRLAKSAYGTEVITSWHLSHALTQFMGMLVSSNSKYDRYTRGEATLSATETNGLSLFQSNCSGCHPAPLFSNYSYRNNGLDSVFSDAGRAVVTALSSDIGKFKVPSLRNIYLTKPYMHDGRFSTLNAVLDHYSSGVKNYPTLDTSLCGGIPLTAQEKLDIIAFLKTLTDENFIRDRRFFNPFTN